MLMEFYLSWKAAFRFSTKAVMPSFLSSWKLEHSKFKNEVIFWKKEINKWKKSDAP